jgi:hypothetical protein
MNTNWPRWIAISIAKHFADQSELTLISVENDITQALNAGKLPLFIEGQYRKQRDMKRLCELRWDGPEFIETAKNQWLGRVTINAHIQVAVEAGDLWTQQRAQGIAGVAFTDIEIFKYGDGVDDDESSLGCLRLIQDPNRGQAIRIMNFGTTDADIQQSAIEADFEIDLTT